MMRHLSVLLFAVVLAGCGSLARIGPDDLKKSVRTYNDAVRWKAWQKAATFVDEAQRAAWLHHRTSAAGSALQIADVQVGAVERANSQAIDALVLVNVSWYRLPDTTLRVTTWRQTWRHFSKRGWRLMKEEQAVVEPAQPAAPVPPTDAAPAQWP